MAQFTNQAQLTYNNNVISSNVAVGEILDAVTVQKAAIAGNYSPGGSVTYLISIVNSGNAPITGVTINDDLGGYTFNANTVYPLAYVPNTAYVLVNGVLQPTPTVTAGPPLSVSGLTVPANSNLVLAYNTTVTDFAPPQTTGTITNNATVSGNGITTPLTATKTINTANEPILSITKSIEPIPVAPSGTVTYTFVIENTGNAAANATDNIVLRDTFNPILENITVTCNGVPWVAGTDYTYNTTTGLFTSTSGNITVPAATSVQDPTTGNFVITPGITTIVITGTV